MVLCREPELFYGTGPIFSWGTLWAASRMPKFISKSGDLLLIGFMHLK